MNKLQFSASAKLTKEFSDIWYEPVNDAMLKYGIFKAQDKAMFIAQIGHESGNFKYTIESFNYSPEGLISIFGNRISDSQARLLGRTEEHSAQEQEIANLVYLNRLGNLLPEDGWRYRGRGLIQITGRYNYHQCGKALDLNIVDNPQLLELPFMAAYSAAWFYVKNKCLEYTGDVVKITKKINGGLNGLDDRNSRYKYALSLVS